MPLLPNSLPPHPDGQKVNKVDPESLGYRTQSKWRDRYCGNCPVWFQENPDAAGLPSVMSDEHPEADGKGTVHECGLVGGAIARGGYCLAWGTAQFCPAAEEQEPGSEDERVQRSMAKIWKRLRLLSRADTHDGNA